MVNFLEETIEVLNRNGKSISDVRAVADMFNKTRCSWNAFAAKADFLYDNGFGGVEIFMALMIFGDDWYMRRREYDGQEWWEFVENINWKNLIEGSVILTEKEYFNL